MKVQLLSNTPSPEKVVAAAARLCYSDKGAMELMDNLTEEKTQAFINRLSSLGHGSPFEHVSFTFAIDDISRSCSHQLVRHRIASYSQKSQRYVQEDQFGFVTPKSIESADDLLKIYDDHMKAAQEVYDELTKGLMDKGMDKKEAIEDARYILPNSCSTSLVVTMNVRTLDNFFNLRCCNRAQDEIRELANEMLKLVKGVAPNIFKYSGKPCLKGYCPEGNMQCEQLKGKIPTLGQLLDKQ